MRRTRTFSSASSAEDCPALWSFSWSRLFAIALLAASSIRITRFSMYPIFGLPGVGGETRSLPRFPRKSAIKLALIVKSEVIRSVLVQRKSSQALLAYMRTGRFSNALARELQPVPRKSQRSVHCHCVFGVESAGWNHLEPRLNEPRGPKIYFIFLKHSVMLLF
jgi:hypothetical protein